VSGIFSEICVFLSAPPLRSNLNDTLLTVSFARTARDCFLEKTFVNCSAVPNCVCTPRLVGDDCENGVAIAIGSTNATTEGATTCHGCGSCAILNDVWYQWNATCTGTATINACSGSQNSSMLGIYRGMCPSASTPTASGSGTCGLSGACNGRGAIPSIDVMIGESILIQLGTSSPGAIERVDLNVSCTERTTVVTAINTSVSTAAETISASTKTSVVTSTMDESFVSTEPETTSLVQPQSTTPIIAGVLGAVGGVLLIGGIVACVFVILKNKKHSTAGTATPMEPVYTLYEPAADSSMLRLSDAFLPEEKTPPATDNSATVPDPVARQANLLQIPLDGLDIGQKLGEGAFGVVYKGKWHGSNVAVKQVKASVISGEQALADFAAEVATMAKVPFHGNLVQLHGVTKLDNGDLAAVVEFCANGALVTALYGDKARAEWAPGALVRIAHGAACGVAHLHRLDFVHRDIAARNVLLTKSDEPKVADFGMARLVSDGVYEQQTASVVGPVKWMAPEQMERRSYSKASDVFAFGVLLFEIFMLEPPWKGHSNIVAATKVLAGEHLDVSSSTIPRKIAALMETCWAMSKKERPAMEHVQRVLHELASDDSSSE